MRLAWVMGRVTLSRRAEETRPGSWLVCEALEADSLEDEPMRARPRGKSMPESWVVFDQLGAGQGDVIAVAEGGEACNPFYPDRVPLDAYCAAIVDSISEG